MSIDYPRENKGARNLILVRIRKINTNTHTMISQHSNLDSTIVNINSDAKNAGWKGTYSEAFCCSG